MIQMKNYSWFQMWVAASMIAAPSMLHAQQPVAEPAGQANRKPAPELPSPPGPPKPPPRFGKADGPKPGKELQKLSVLSGTLVKPIANDRAEYDAFLLKTSAGEVLVKFPPHMGEQLIGKRQEGEDLKVTGFYRNNPDGAKEFQLVSAEINGRTVIDAPPPPPREMVPPQQRVLNATIQSLRYTPKKDINGFVLSSGENVTIPPHIGQQLAMELKVGEKVTVSGFAEPKSSGVVYSKTMNFFKAQTITVGGQAYLIR
jgi:hypothetical protein